MLALYAVSSAFHGAAPPTPKAFHGAATTISSQRSALASVQSMLKHTSTTVTLTKEQVAAFGPGPAVRPLNDRDPDVNDVDDFGRLAYTSLTPEQVAAFGGPAIRELSYPAFEETEAELSDLSAQLAQALSDFRDAVRQQAIAGKKSPEGLPTELLQLCDALRDQTLPALGVKIDDRPSGVAQWSMEDPKLLLAEAERAREMAQRSEEMRQAKLAEKAARAQLDAQRNAVPPAQMFLPEHDALFERESSLGGLDDDGLPTLDAQGEPLSKSARKKLVKQRDKHANAHAAATAQ